MKKMQKISSIRFCASPRLFFPQSMCVLLLFFNFCSLSSRSYSFEKEKKVSRWLFHSTNKHNHHRSIVFALITIFFHDPRHVSLIACMRVVVHLSEIEGQKTCWKSTKYTKSSYFIGKIIRLSKTFVPPRSQLSSRKICSGPCRIFFFFFWLRYLLIACNTFEQTLPR